MANAGVWALVSCRPDENDFVTVEEVYIAMRRARSRQLRDDRHAARDALRVVSANEQGSSEDQPSCSAKLLVR